MAASIPSWQRLPVAAYVWARYDNERLEKETEREGEKETEKGSVEVEQRENVMLFINACQPSVPVM